MVKVVIEKTEDFIIYFLKKDKKIKRAIFYYGSELLIELEFNEL